MRHAVLIKFDIHQFVLKLSADKLLFLYAVVEEKQTKGLSMKRREFVKTIPLTALLPTGLAALTGNAQAANTETGNTSAGNTGGQASSGASGTGAVPEYAADILTSDMNGLGPDGKPTGQTATFTGASKANVAAEEAAKHQMKLTEEEQAILDGKEGPEMAKLKRKQFIN
jgi:hypothetical protein